LRNHLRAAAVVGLLSALTSWSCRDGTPTGPSEFPSTTEAYSGALNPGEGAAFHFSIQNPGQLDAYIASLSAGSNVDMGLRLGFWDGEICEEQLYTETARVGLVLSGDPQGPGEYCVAIYDVGNLQAATDFGLTVTHY
jgi:hypothetical protein